MTSSFISSSTSSTTRRRTTRRRLGLQEEVEVLKPSHRFQRSTSDGMVRQVEIEGANDDSKTNEIEPTTSSSIAPLMESKAESVGVSPTMAAAAAAAAAARNLDRPTAIPIIAEEDGKPQATITSTTSKIDDHLKKVPKTEAGSEKKDKERKKPTKGRSNESIPETATTKVFDIDAKTDDINVNSSNKNEQQEETNIPAENNIPSKTRTSPKQMLSIASPYGEVTADTSNKNGQQQETNNTPAGNNIPSKTRTSPKQMLSIASPYGEVAAIRVAPPTCTAGTADIGGMAISNSGGIGGNDDNKASIVAALRLSPQRPVPPRIYMASPSDFVDNESENNNNAATNDIRRQGNRIGAFRVGVDGGGSSEILNGGSAPRQSASNKSTTTAIAVEIEAELAPNYDVEALVEERIRERERELAVAEVARVNEEEDDDEESKGIFKIKRKHLLGFVLFLIIAIVSSALIVSFSDKSDKGEVTDDESNSTQPPPEIPSGPTLEEVKKRGLLRCGVDEFAIGFSFHNTTTGQDDGFLIDICRALALTVLGDPEKIEVVYVTSVNRFQLLRERKIDVLAQLATITMSRDVFQEMTFSAPFHYTGLAFAGDPTYVECADRLDSFSGPCRDLKLCIQQGTTHEIILDEIFPGPERILTPELRDSVANLENGRCNAVAQDSVAISEPLLRVLGYKGPYQLGSKLFSKEPLALATHDRDPEWSKIVNMVINTLYTAESLGITQGTTGSDLSELLKMVEDEHLASLFADVISTVGNMGELYERHLEGIFPRQGLNLLNMGDSGLIYSFPFGNVERTGELVVGGVIESILARQKLRCGVSRRPGFADFNATSSTWTGLDIEFCVAVSAAIFSRSARDHVDFIEVTNDNTDRLDFIADGEIDILAGERVTLQNLWLDPGTDSGYSFSAPYFYGGTGQDGNDGSDSFALATLRNDTQWSDFVYWVTMSTFFAEESGIGRASSIDLPIVSLFGESVKQMFRDVIFEVGSYGDIYNRTIGTIYPRSARNMLNLGNTPQVYGFPLA